jgi:hypothetical protein
VVLIEGRFCIAEAPTAIRQQKEQITRGAVVVLGCNGKGTAMSDFIFEGEKRYRALFEQAGDATLLIEPETGRLFGSKHARVNASRLRER